MVDSLISNALEKLNTILRDEVDLLVGVTSEIQRLSGTFTLLQAVLKDAETRRLKDEAVKKWLENLKDVAYDVDDILDEWTTDALRPQAPDEGDGSCFSFLVTCYLSCVTFFNHVMLRHKIGSRIKEVRGRLDDILNQKNLLGLIVASGESEVRGGEIGSLLDRSSVVGREDDRNVVLNLLLRESGGKVNEVPFVISIVGMGGLGKTTLAQLAYNDEKVKGYFEMRMWVCVSEDFDVKRITKSIIKSADTEFTGKNFDLDQLQLCLREMLHEKRFLIVLDDIWSEDNEKWDRLKLPFQTGALGSRIVITTRNEKVAFAMGRGHIHQLAILSDVDCWLLFSHIALKRLSAEEEERSELEEIGRHIVERCGGLPLAVKTIGSAMCSRRTRREWEQVLQSEVWNSDYVLQGILPALSLSYHDLPPALKQCFAYLSIFPKDWKIEKDKIVKLWVAQGFIGSDRSRDMEKTGGLYFDDLLRRSLLQDAVLYYGDDQKIARYKMHDLVHDLAQSVAGSECSVVEMRKQSSLNLNNLRHLFLIDSDDAGDRDDKADEVASIWATLYKAQKLRTLLLYSRKVPNNLFNHFRHLRALALKRTSIQNLPRTLGKLKHLRYLDLSETMIEELPEGVSNCRNLQTLILNDCYHLKKLPRGMGKMISLRHLELEDTSELKYLPRGIGKLSSLRTLTEFIVGGDDEGCKWGELKHLNHLQGSLQIAGLENLRSRDEAMEGELYKKQHLHALCLRLRCDYGRDVSDDELKRAEEVLEILQPHKNLKELEILSYKGSKFPSGWLGQLKALQTLKIMNCYNLRSLPEDLQHLTKLQQLEIWGCPELGSLPVELRHLAMLQKLMIWDCPGLRSLPEGLRRLTMLQELNIYRCPVLEERCCRGGEDCYKIAHIPNITFGFQ